jgi:hypothetical protein
LNIVGHLQESQVETNFAAEVACWVLSGIVDGVIAWVVLVVVGHAEEGDVWTVALVFSVGWILLETKDKSSPEIWAGWKVLEISEESCTDSGIGTLKGEGVGICWGEYLLTIAKRERAAIIEAVFFIFTILFYFK